MPQGTKHTGEAQRGLKDCSPEERRLRGGLGESESLVKEQHTRPEDSRFVGARREAQRIGCTGGTTCECSADERLVKKQRKDACKRAGRGKKKRDTDWKTKWSFPLHAFASKIARNFNMDINQKPGHSLDTKR